MRQFFFIISFSLLFNGCVTSYTNFPKLKDLSFSSTTDFSSIIENLLDDLCPTLKKLSKKKPLTVIDFTNLKELENNSELGFILSEELKTHVTQKCNWMVNQIEFMRYIKVGANGTKLFSRDLNDIKNENLNDTGYALVGTYAFTQKQLRLYLKIIDLSNGVIIKSSTYETSLTNEIIHLEKKPESTTTSTTKQYNYQPIVL